LVRKGFDLVRVNFCLKPYFRMKRRWESTPC